MPQRPEDLSSSRPVAESPQPEHGRTIRETIPEREVNPGVKNSDLPKGVDKPDGVLESVNDDLQRVEKRTTS